MSGDVAIERKHGAVVTGAGRGLGKQIAGVLARRGYRVLVTDVDAEAAAATAAEINGDAISMAVDVREQAQTDAARNQIIEHAGRLDLWVNNAGVLVTGPAWEQDEVTRRLMIEVNAIGTMNGTLSALGAMRPDDHGHIINIVSLAGLSSVPGEAVYAASKHAAIGFSLSTIADLRLAGVKNVDISCICPDGIWTPMLFDKLDDPAAALSFSGKLLEPEDVVKVISKVVDKPRLVTTIPAWRGALVRLGDNIPNLGLGLLPYIVKHGRRTQLKLLHQRKDG